MKKYLLSKYVICLLCLAILGSTSYPEDVEFPLIQSISYFPYSDNSLVKKGEFSGAVDFYYSNVYMFNEQRTTINDFEALSTTLGIRYGLWQGTTLELYLRHSAIFGGILDKFIEDFHSTFNMPDNDRPDYPRNAVHYRFHDSFFYTGNQNAVSPFVLGLLKELYRSPYFSLKTRVSLGLPLSNKPGFSSDKPFLCLGLVLDYKRGWFSLEAANYLSFFKKPSWLGDEDIYPNLFLSGLEARLWRFIFGFTFRTSVFKEGDIAHGAYQCYFGYKITRFLELIILEDFVPFDTTPDVSFLIRVKFL